MRSRDAQRDIDILRLAMRSPQDLEGWAEVSERVWPLVADVPDDVLEKRPAEGCGQIRLTPAAHIVLRYT